MSRKLKKDNARLARDAEQAEALANYARFAARRFETLFHGLPAACFTFDEEGTIFEWNSAARRTFGLAAPDVIGRKVIDVLSPSNEFLISALTAEYATDVEWTRGDQWFLSHAQILEGADGGPCGTVCSTIDISDRKRAERDLEKAYANLEVAEAMAGMGSWTVDLGTRVHSWSKNMFAIYDLEPAEAAPSLEQIYTWIHPDDQEMVMEAVDQLHSELLPREIEHRLLTGAGNVKHVVVVFKPILEQNRIMGTVQDVTTKLEAELALQTSEARLHESQLFARLGSWEYDLEENRSVWSKALFSLLGLPTDSKPLSLPAFLRMIHVEDREPTMALIRESMRAGGRFDMRYRIVLRNKTTMHIRAIGETYLRNGRPCRMLGTIQDITEQVEAEAELEAANAKLEALARSDGLTGIKNHRAFQEFLETQFQLNQRYGSPLSMILLDVDSFKPYNDAYGHQAGDEVLRRIAALLVTEARKSDLVARYGGEEFVVVLPDTKLESAVSLAERLRGRIAVEAFPHRPVTASFGVSTVRLTMPDRETLILEADQALYLSKQNGRNRVTYFGSSGMPVKSTRFA